MYNFLINCVYNLWASFVLSTLAGSEDEYFSSIDSFYGARGYPDVCLIIFIERDVK